MLWWCTENTIVFYGSCPVLFSIREYDWIKAALNLSECKKLVISYFSLTFGLIISQSLLKPEKGLLLNVYQCVGWICTSMFQPCSLLIFGISFFLPVSQDMRAWENSEQHRQYVSHSMCEAFAQASPDFPHDFEQTGCVMEQEQMSKLVTEAAVPICRRHMSPIAPWWLTCSRGVCRPRQTSSAWDSFWVYVWDRWI